MFSLNIFMQITSCQKFSCCCEVFFEALFLRPLLSFFWNLFSDPFCNNSWYLFYSMSSFLQNFFILLRRHFHWISLQDSLLAKHLQNWFIFKILIRNWSEWYPFVCLAICPSCDRFMFPIWQCESSKLIFTASS